MNVKTYAVIKDGRVGNLILVDEENLPEIKGALLVPAGEGADKEGRYEHDRFMPEKSEYTG